MKAAPVFWCGQNYVRAVCSKCNGHLMVRYPAPDHQPTICPDCKRLKEQEAA